MMAPTIARDDVDIDAAIDAVEKIFPFPGYITRGSRQAVKHIAAELLKHAAGPNLLDIGSGPMNKTGVFQAVGFRCSAVDDLSDEWHRRDDNLERILRFAKDAGIRFHLQDFGEYGIPFETGSFDVVTINSVIEHLHSSPRDILNTAGEFLKEGGVLCVTMPNSVNIRKRMSVLRGKTNYPPVDQFFHSEGVWRGHVREYTPSETEFICREAGFEVLSRTTYDGIAYDKLRGLKLSLYLFLSNLAPTLRSYACVVARKPVGWKPRQVHADEAREARKASVPSAVH